MRLILFVVVGQRGTVVSAAVAGSIPTTAHVAIASISSVHPSAKWVPGS